MQPNARYEIRVEGIFDAPAHFGDACLRSESIGETTLMQFVVADPCALFGLIKRIRDHGLTLISVNRIEPPFYKQEYLP